MCATDWTSMLTNSTTEMRMYVVRSITCDVCVVVVRATTACATDWYTCIQASSAIQACCAIWDANMDSNAQVVAVIADQRWNPMRCTKRQKDLFSDALVASMDAEHVGSHEQPVIYCCTFVLQHRLTHLQSIKLCSSNTWRCLSAADQLWPQCMLQSLQATSRL